MSFYLKAAAGIGSSLLIVLALVIALLKGLIGLIGFITTAIKIIIILGFVAVFMAVGLMIFKTIRDRQSAE
jgi:hypothetical protein